MDNFQKIILKWNNLQFTLNDNESNLLNKTEIAIKSLSFTNNKLLEEFYKLKLEFKKLDFHPLETGMYDEIEKWDKLREEMIMLLNSIQESIPACLWD